MIYSIGHGNKKAEVFLSELTSFNVKYVIDVRSRPYSKYSTQYNREALTIFLKDAGITYVYLGENLGGLPADRTCYTDDKVDYDIVRTKKFFKEGIERLILANEKQIDVAVMCSESKPENCHRSKLIGQELSRHNVSMVHILSKNMTKDQVTIMNELTKFVGTVDLFGNETSFTSRKKYK